MQLTRTLTVLLCFLAAIPGGAQTIQVAAPASVKIPSAFGGQAGTNIRFRIEQNGQYAIACSDKEGRIWKLPEGILIYRFQQTQNLGSVAWNVLRDVTITPDGRFAFASGTSWNENIIAPVDLTTGKAVGPGRTLDSLKSGAYQMRLGARNMRELEWNLQLGLSNKLVRKRDYEPLTSKVTETMSTQDLVRDAQNPGSIIICFMQQYCRGGRWLKDNVDKLGESYKEHRQDVEKHNHCQLMDMHVVRFNPANGESTYLGPGVPGVQGIDYGRLNEVHVSPYGDVVAVEFQQHYDTFHIYSVAGQKLWSVVAKDVLGFDDRGNVIVRKKAGNEVIVSKHKPFTGVEVMAYKLPASYPDLRILDNWGMAANIQKADEGNMGISLHDIHTGRMMAALVDPDAAKAFSARYKAEAEEAARREAEAIRANRLAWERAQKESEEAEEAAAKQEAVRYAARKETTYVTCYACSGKGYNKVTVRSYSQVGGVGTIGSTGYVDWQRAPSSIEHTSTEYRKCQMCSGTGQVAK